MNFESTYNVNNTDLNFSTDISCKGVENSGGKIISGFAFEKDNNAKYNIKTSNCANLKLATNVGDIKKGVVLDEVCDCEIVSINNNILTCPKNKFIKTYFPTLNKISCCSPCTNNGTIKTEFNDDKCQDVLINPTTHIAMCPKDMFVSKIDLQNSKISCCPPVIGGSYGQEIMKINEKCKQMGIDNNICMNDSSNIVKRLEETCKKYGIKDEDCKYNNIINFEKKCDTYGMKYTSIDGGQVKNPSSYLECHKNNFDDLDRFCTQNSITPCNWENIQIWKDNSNSNIKNLSGLFKNTKSLWIIVVVILIILLIVFVCYKFNEPLSKYTVI
jgi:hypothetical protein